MGTIECSQPASKSSWDSQDFGDISMVLKMAHFRKSTGPSSSNRKYPPFPLLPYFSVVVCLRWLYYHILSSITYISREHWDFVSIICVQSIDVQSMVFANDRIHYGLQVVFVCLQITPSYYHHYADSSEGIELIKCLSGICCRVCV